MNTPAAPKAPVPPNAQQLTEALRVMRERYRRAVPNIVAAFRYRAAQLTVAPEKKEVLEPLRRELHRVHGTAGSFGFPDASRLAGVLEARAVRWIADPAFDRTTRGAIIAHFASAIEAHVVGIPAPPAPPHVRPRRPGTTPGQAAPAEPAAAAPTPVTPDRARARSPDVIFVEDDPSLTEMLRYALQATGYSFRHYGSGPEALAGLLALDPGQRRPVVLLDVDLPGLDGFSLYERLRAAQPDAYAVVFFTVHAAEAEQLRAYRAGVIDYVTKPVNMRILMAKIPSWLERASKRA
jgi:CheY-like chemotaxis protein